MKANSEIQKLLGIKFPIIQAPMSGYADAEMAIAVSEAGGLGSLPCARLLPEQVIASVVEIRKRTSKPINLNFFCHTFPDQDSIRETSWRMRLASYYAEFGIEAPTVSAGKSRRPFDEAMCGALEQLKPSIISFHFGLPPESLLARVKATGAIIISSATTVEEACWLEAVGCDLIIAQGFEAGGHRGMFIAKDPGHQIGTLALVPQIVDAVRVPVIAAGGIGDARGIVAALALGASAVQIGTAFLLCDESRVTPIHRRALKTADSDSTILTNVLTGRPARGISNRLIQEVGPISDDVPKFPLAAAAVSPLSAAAEALGSEEFSQLWAGQAAAFAREMSAGELTRNLATESSKLLEKIGRAYL